MRGGPCTVCSSEHKGSIEIGLVNSAVGDRGWADGGPLPFSSDLSDLSGHEVISIAHVRTGSNGRAGAAIGVGAVDAIIDVIVGIGPKVVRFVRFFRFVRFVRP